MYMLRALLWCFALLPAVAGAGAEVGIATIADSGSRVLRGATWYKLVPGARLEESDIVEVAERAHVQIELVSGSALNLAGPGTVHLAPAPPRPAAPGAAVTVSLARAWAKIAAKPPGVRIHTPQAAILSADGVVVIRAAASPELFVESGGARLIELAPNGAESASHEAKRGEHWSRSTDGAFAMVPRAPKGFVDAMPRQFVDPLPTLAARFKSKPELAIDHEVTYAEAQPWLAGRERAAFEKRFASRLRDPAFRKAVEPNIFRYPSWDRMLHPEKYAPKPKPAP